ncbi:MAG TPA: ATP-binding cassette domain-containing protein, partial [Microbacterium sp.]|nr:ATP-binding cassette domain-containing protein [Microbacterium sp.]
ATQHVRDEIGLALELRGVARPIVDARVSEIATRVGVTALLGRELRGLSAGEATLVAIAAAIVEQPILLLVDEPLADLDVTARARIVVLLAALAHDAGMCVVVAEHRADEFTGVVDGWLRVDGGQVIDGTLYRSQDHAADTTLESASARETGPLILRTVRPTVLTAAGITVRRGVRVVVDDASVTLAAGEVVALRGPNGAGKSSLLVALATGDAARGVALVPDDSDALFVRDTVAAECRRADRRARRAAGTTAARLAGLLTLEPEDPALEARLRRHPRDLSVGERRCLAIAVQTAADPRVLLLDEPTRGLDPRARDLVASAVLRLADSGTAVLFATHDDAFATLADRTLAMDAGVLCDVSRPAPLPAQPRHTRHGSDSRVREEIRTQEGDLASTRPPERRSPPGRATLDARGRATPDGRARDGRGHHARPTPRTIALIAANIAAAAAFLWPLIAIATPRQAQAAVPYIALSLAPLAIVLVLAALDASVRSAHTLALLAVLAAIGAAIRIVSTGVGGVEALFVLLVLAGRAFGPRFGLLLGAASIALSALMWGGVGPWLPFQMFA